MSSTKQAALEVPGVTPDQLDLVRKTVANGATADELKLYLYDCARQGVHPLDKLLHFTKRGGRYTPITSIDLMRTRAADSGEYAGNDDAVFEQVENAQPVTAMVTVYRMVQGTRCAFSATARWDEYYPGDKQGTMWRKMPHTMLGKCAEALALRKAFPRQLAGLYAREEMDQADTPRNGTTPVSVEPPEPPELYDEWAADVEVAADEGYAAFSAIIKAAANTDNLKYATAHDKERFTALRKKAQQVPA